MLPSTSLHSNCVVFCCAAFVGAVCGAGFVLSSRVYSLYKGGSPIPSLKHTLTAAISVLVPRNFQAAMYSVFTVITAYTAYETLGSSPGRSMLTLAGYMGPVTVWVRRVTGAGLLLSTLVWYSLKDGADRGKLGATAFR